MKTRNSFIYVLAIALMFAFIGCTNPSTPAGHEGYVKEDPRIWGTGGFQGTLIGPKNFGVAIWNNKVENIDMRPTTYTESFKILTADELNIDLKYEVIISVKSGTVQDVVEKWGGNAFYKRNIVKPLRSMVQKVVQVRKGTDVKTERIGIEADVNGQLKEYMKDMPFVLVKGVVGTIGYPKVITDAVENKLAQKQKLEEKDTLIAIALKDAEIRIADANGIAEAQRIINSTLTANYLQHEAIAAQKGMAASPNHTTVYIPSGANGIPLVRTIQ